MDQNFTTEHFENDQIQDLHLPQLATLEYSPLEVKLLWADLIIGTLFFCIPIVSAIVIQFVFKAKVLQDNGFWIYPMLVFLFIISTTYTYFSFYKKSYAIRQRDIVYNAGLFWKKSTVVPFNRVQHCEVSQNPIDRWFSLSQLKIFTAGGSSSDLAIEGLSPETANRIKDFIVTKASISDEEE